MSDSRTISRLVDFARALPLDDRVELLRQLLPITIAGLDEGPRNALVTELNYAIARHARR